MRIASQCVTTRMETAWLCIYCQTVKLWEYVNTTERVKANIDPPPITGAPYWRTWIIPLIFEVVAPLLTFSGYYDMSAPWVVLFRIPFGTHVTLSKSRGSYLYQSPFGTLLMSHPIFTTPNNGSPIFMKNNYPPGVFDVMAPLYTSLHMLLSLLHIFICAIEWK